MEPNPVQHHEQPGYPTRREVLAGAATFALVNLAGGCFVFARLAEEGGDSGKIVVAPIFEHGEGRGVTGCVVVVAPVFLSEEEGMQIVREELARHGIQLKAGSTLEGVLVPARIEKDESVGKGGGKLEFKTTVVEDPDHAKPLKPSGIDSEKRIAVEFVSTEDYRELGGLGARGSVEVYDFKEAAQYVAAQVKKQGKAPVFFGVFYDPSPKKIEVKPSKEDPLDRLRYDSAASSSLAEARPTIEDSKRLLREQAQDFLAWLKEQKAIP